MKYLLLALTLLAAPSFAEDFQQDLDKLCEKTMACAKAQLPPAMRGMAEQMMGGMCQAYDQAFKVGENPQYQDAYAAAKKCISSMAALSCAELMDDPETPACDSYQDLAAQYNQE